jgi:DNA-binding MarR family transcriptional regulator
MAAARVKLPDDLDGLLLREMEACIEQANLGQYDTLIARRYLISQLPQIEIAAELGWTRSTVSLHIPRIIRKVSLTANRLGLNHT